MKLQARKRSRSRHDGHKVIESSPFALLCGEQVFATGFAPLSHRACLSTFDLPSIISPPTFKQLFGELIQQNRLIANSGGCLLHKWLIKPWLIGVFSGEHREKKGVGSDCTWVKMAHATLSIQPYNLYLMMLEAAEKRLVYRRYVSGHEFTRAVTRSWLARTYLGPTMEEDPSGRIPGRSLIEVRGNGVLTSPLPLHLLQGRPFGDAPSPWHIGHFFNFSIDTNFGNSFRSRPESAQAYHHQNQHIYSMVLLESAPRNDNLRILLFHSGSFPV